MDHLHRLVRAHSIRMRLEYLRTDDVARQSIYVPGGAKGVKCRDLTLGLKRTKARNF